MGVERRKEVGRPTRRTGRKRESLLLGGGWTAECIMEVPVALRSTAGKRPPRSNVALTFSPFYLKGPQAPNPPDGG